MRQGGPSQRRSAELMSWVQEGEGGRAVEQEGEMGIVMGVMVAAEARAERERRRRRVGMRVKLAESATTLDVRIARTASRQQKMQNTVFMLMWCHLTLCSRRALPGTQHMGICAIQRAYRRRQEAAAAAAAAAATAAAELLPAGSCPPQEKTFFKAFCIIVMNRNDARGDRKTLKKNFLALRSL